MSELLAPCPRFPGKYCRAGCPHFGENRDMVEETADKFSVETGHVVAMYITDPRTRTMSPLLRTLNPDHFGKCLNDPVQ